MMKTIKYFLALLVLMASHPLYAQNRFVVYKASRGVVLQSSDQSINKDLKRGTPIFDDDKFLLNNEHFYIKIKEINSGEIFSFSGRDTLTAKEIANQQKYYLFDKFRKFLLSQTSEFGFNVSPITTSQCVTSKGGKNFSESIDSLSYIIASNITTDIQTDCNYHGVVIQKEFIDDDIFNYVVVNNDTSTYALVIYSVGKDGLNKHNNVITYESGSFRPSKIEYYYLPGKFALKLDYFCLSSTDDDERTLYAILFNPSDLYVKTEHSLIYDYECLINWSIIERGLKFIGNDERVIFIRK